VGGYEVLGEVGRGGMSVVYKARQAHPDRVVALKVLLAGGHAAAEQRARFLAEADALARLHHRNVVQVYEAGEHEGLPFLALEHVAGGTLARRLGGKPLPTAEAAALVETLARAVDAAHRAGVIHRDLKPANVLIAEDGTPKVTDFGLAKQARSDLTATGMVLGTPSYMAPEQALGDNRAVGPAADVYALGAILYECLTGRPPFQGATALETLEQVVAQEPVPPSQLQARTPRDLGTVCLKCLRKEPHQRYATALDLAEDLRRFRAGEPIHARPTGALERTWRWAHRRPAVAALLATVVALLLVVAVGGSAAAIRLGQALAESQRHLEGATRARNDARSELWVSYLDQARAVRRSQRRGQRLESLAAVRKALELPVPPGRSPAELRNEAASALGLPDVEIVRQWAPTASGELNLSFDAALERYSHTDRRGLVSIRRVADDEEIVRLPRPASACQAWLSPDGRLAAVLDRGTHGLQVWRLTGPSPVVVHEAKDVTNLYGALFSPDSRRLIYGHGDGRIGLVTLADNQVTVWRAPGTEVWGFCCRPDGRQAAFRRRVNGQDTLSVCDVPGGAVQASLPHPSWISSIAWDPGGRLLATCCDDLRIRLWDTATWRQTLVLEGHKTRGIHCVFTPDGERLLSNDWLSLLRVWDVHSGRQLFATATNRDLHHFSPDGRLAVTDAVEAALLHIASGREFRTLPRRTAAGPRAYATEHGGIALSPTGRLLAVTTEEGACAFVDPATGAELGAIRRNRTIPLQFEASGALLTHGSAGLCRWPVQEDPATGRCRVGPPQPLFPSQSFDRYGSTADGRVLAIPAYGRGAVLLERGPPGRLRVLGPQEDVRFCAVSPDGRWVATGNHFNTQGIGVKVWEASSGRLVKELPMNGSCQVGFSPDGRWLVTTGVECRLWAVDTWQEGPLLGKVTAFAFPPDGRVLAAGAEEPGVIRLVETATGREYVRLEAPEQTRLVPQCFTPDGSQLIAFGVESQALHVWDLRRIRRQLAEMGLDWDAPPLPEAPAEAPPPVSAVEVDLSGRPEPEALPGRALNPPGPPHVGFGRGFSGTTRWKCSVTSPSTTRRSPSTRHVGSWSLSPMRTICSNAVPGGTVNVSWWMIWSPASSSGTMKWTVAPYVSMRWLKASRYGCAPGNAGSRPWCKLMIRPPANRQHTDGGISRMYRASTM
jgi:WD40 repeat protein/tRNA A-37 threonylcarbamoyl transferase component Bud32